MPMMMEFPVNNDSSEWEAFGDNTSAMKTSDPFQPFGNDGWTQKLEYGDAAPTISSSDIEKYGYETTPEHDGRDFNSLSISTSKKSGSSFGPNRRRRHSIDHFTRYDEDKIEGFDPFFPVSSPNGVDVQWKKSAACGDKNNALSSADINKYGYEYDVRTGSSSTSSSSQPRSRQQRGRRKSMELFSALREPEAFDRPSCHETGRVQDDDTDAFGAVSVNSNVKHFRKAVRRNSNGAMRKRLQARQNSSNNLEDEQDYPQQNAVESSRTSRSKSPSARRPKLNRSLSDDNLLVVTSNSENMHPTTRRRVCRRTSVGGFENNHESIAQNKGRDRGTNRRRRGSLGKAPAKTCGSGALGDFFNGNGAHGNNNDDDGTVYTTPVFSSSGRALASSSTSSSVYATPEGFSSSSSRRTRRRGSLDGSSALRGADSSDHEYVDSCVALKDDPAHSSGGATFGRRHGGRRHQKEQHNHCRSVDRSRSGERSRKDRSGSPPSRKAPARSLSFDEVGTKKANRYRLEDRQTRRRHQAVSEVPSKQERVVSHQNHDELNRRSEHRHRDRQSNSGRRSKSPPQQQRRRTGRRNSMI